MGLLTSQITTEYLTLYKNDLEQNIDSIHTAQMRLMAMSDELANTGSDLSPDSPEFKLLEQRKQKLALVNKQLDQSLERYQSQLAAVEAREKGVQEQLSKNIQSSFSYNLGGK